MGLLVPFFFFYLDGSHTQECTVQIGCGGSTLGDTQNLTEQGPKQHALTRALDLKTFRRPF